MKVVIQRVRHAAVEVEGETIASIGHGLLVLVGVHVDDTADDLQYVARKTAALRIFNDADGVMNLSVGQTGGEILSVSQFTLLAKTARGNRPSYIDAARAPLATDMYRAFNALVGQLAGCRVVTGQFGADMQVSLLNDGPVTIVIDSRSRE